MCVPNLTSSDLKTHMQPKDKPTIIVDTKEQKPWDLAKYGFNIVNDSLKFGDYCVYDNPNLVCIERKASTGEIANNLGKLRSRFESEFEKMQVVKHKYLILEFPIDRFYEFPNNSGIPRSAFGKVRMNGNYMLAMINGYSKVYGLNIIYSKDRQDAEQKAARILHEVLGNAIEEEDLW